MLDLKAVIPDGTDYKRRAAAAGLRGRHGHIGVLHGADTQIGKAHAVRSGIRAGVLRVAPFKIILAVAAELICELLPAVRAAGAGERRLTWHTADDDELEEIVVSLGLIPILERERLALIDPDPLRPDSGVGAGGVYIACLNILHAAVGRVLRHWVALIGIIHLDKCAGRAEEILMRP